MNSGRPAGFLRRNRVQLLVLAVALSMALVSGAVYFGSSAGGFDQAGPAGNGQLDAEGYTLTTADAAPDTYTGTGDAARTAGDGQPRSGAGEPGADPGTSSPEAAAGSSPGDYAAPSSSPAPGTAGGGTTPPPAGSVAPGGGAPQGLPVTLVIDSGARRLEYSLRVDEGSTVFDLLLEASGRYGFSFDYSNNSSYGAFVEELDGVRNDPRAGMFWLYYVNGNYASLGASSQILSEGDVILWRYQSTR